MFLIAAFIAFGAAPLVGRLERWMPRGAAIAVVYLGLVGALVVLALVIVPITYAQLIVLVGHTSDYVIAAQDGVAHLETFVRVALRRPRRAADLRPDADRGRRTASARCSRSPGVDRHDPRRHGQRDSDRRVGADSLGVLLSRGRAVRGGVLALLPPSRRARTNELLVEVASIFGHFVAGQLRAVRDRRRARMGGTGAGHTSLSRCSSRSCAGSATRCRSSG